MTVVVGYTATVERAGLRETHTFESYTHAEMFATAMAARGWTPEPIQPLLVPYTTPSAAIRSAEEGLRAWQPMQAARDPV